MKLTVATLLMALATASAGKTKKVDLRKSIAADSKAGSKLLTQARRVEAADEEFDFTWVSGYSVKFQGCHHMQQWNAEAGGDDAPRVQTKRLVRFRLCPVDSCTFEDASGCDSGYGDYIIDLELFLQAYWENKIEMEEWNCEYTMANECDCEDADDNEACEQACFYDRGMDYCVEEENDDEQEELDVQEYMQCAQVDFPDENRRLEQEEIEYFVGPYCAEGGDEILLGVFNDETCTNFASEGDGGKSVYYDNMGVELPYSSESLVDMNCIPCKEPGDADQQNQNDQADEDEVTEMCEMVYNQAGKCESRLSINYPNENGCNYMEGIKIFRRDGQVVIKSASGSGTANIFIACFAAAFVACGAYVYYLKNKLDRAKINLSE